MDAESRAFAERIFPNTGMKRGNSALPKDQLFKDMTRTEFVQYIRDVTVKIWPAAAAQTCIPVQQTAAGCPLDCLLCFSY